MPPLLALPITNRLLVVSVFLYQLDECRVEHALYPNRINIYQDMIFVGFVCFR
jgi:hypothetical protein